MKAIILFAAFFLLGSSATFACTCIGESTVAGAIKSSDLVVSGKVISKEAVEITTDSTWALGKDSLGNSLFPKHYKTKYRILVLHKFKGNFKQDTLTIITGMGGGDCGYEFIVGQNYIIYGNKYSEKQKGKSTGVYETTICSRTMNYNDSEVEEIKKVIK